MGSVFADTKPSIGSTGVTMPVNDADRQRRRASKLALPVVLFLLSLTIPFIIQLGPIKMTGYRIVLISLVIPLLIAFARRTRIRSFDILLFMFLFWCSLSFVIVHGAKSGLEASGILIIETIGAYLLGRVYIKCADNYASLVGLLFLVVLWLFPFALYETLTGNDILLKIASAIWTSHDEVYKESRMGLDRAQTIFSHPILFGVFCGAAFSLTYYVTGYNRGRLATLLRPGLVFLTSFLSLSSGPITALVAQAGLITWDTVLRGLRQRWKLLIAGVFATTVALELAANRSVPEIFISYFAFNTRTAYNRIHTWEYGTASVLNHPLIGIGFNEWVRPWYMSSSIDMFWLVHAVRHGIPAALLIQLFLLALILATAKNRSLSNREKSYRTGFLITIVGFYLAGWTVHYWDSVYVLFMFLLGSSAWMAEISKEDGAKDKKDRRQEKN